MYWREVCPVINNKIIDFYTELQEDLIERYKSKEFPSTNSAFKSVFLSYLLDTGYTLLADCTFVDFKKDVDNIRLDGYCFSEYFNSLTLLISLYEPKQQPKRIGKTEIERTMNKALKFYRLCDTDYFQDVEESSPGYQAYEFICEHKGNTDTINIVLITNNEAVSFVPNDKKHGSVSIKFDVWDIERLYSAVFAGNSMTQEHTIRLRKKYKAPLKMIRIPVDNDVYDCYVGVIS